MTLQTDTKTSIKAPKMTYHHKPSWYLDHLVYSTLAYLLAMAYTKGCPAIFKEN